MSSLLRLQSQVAGAMIRGTDHAAAAMVVMDRIAPERRLAIHRNHYRISLTDALAATFPVLRQVVGDGIFTRAAAAFIRLQPPASPCLHEYGQAFPAFLAGFGPAAGRPRLTDLGRFEWAINRAFHAEERAPLAAARLMDFTAESVDHLVFSPQPSLALIRSPFALDEIWEMTSSRPVSPASDTVNLAVMRRGTSVKWWSLSGWEWDFLRRLADGHPFGQAVEAAAGQDVTRFFTGILQAGVLADVFLPSSMKGQVHVANDRFTHAGR